MEKLLEENPELEDNEIIAQFKETEEYALPDKHARKRAKKAYYDVTRRLKDRDLNSDSLYEDLLSEKAYELDRVSHRQF